MSLAHPTKTPAPQSAWAADRAAVVDRPRRRDRAALSTTGQMTAAN